MNMQFIVKKIVGKKLGETADIGDLVTAKEIIRRRFIVGLMNDMEESIRRFNVVLGVDYTGERGQQCMGQYFGSNDKKEVPANANGADDGKSKAANDMNSNPHPKILEGSPEYNLLAERNALDMILYNYITLLYAEQKKLIDSYTTVAVV